MLPEQKKREPTVNPDGSISVASSSTGTNVAKFATTIAKGARACCNLLTCIPHHRQLHWFKSENSKVITVCLLDLSLHARRTVGDVFPFTYNEQSLVEDKDRTCINGQSLQR
jgi:hypothetical protein